MTDLPQSLSPETALANKIDLHLQLSGSPGFHLSTEDLQMAVKALRGHAQTPADDETELALLAKRISGAELNYRASYQVNGTSHIETGRRWDKMRKAGDAIRQYFFEREEAVSDTSTSRNSTPWDAHHNRSYEPVETRAKEIYDFFEYRDVGTKPAWVPGGNSLMQDEARICARKQLRDAGHAPSDSSPNRKDASHD